MAEEQNDLIQSQQQPGDVPPHEDAAAPTDELADNFDPAAQSLSDALRVSFGLLKIVMLVLIVLYLLSGWFQVATQEAAIRLRFGALVQPTEGDAVYTKGWHFSWPYPIEQVIKVPVTPRTITLGGVFNPEGDERLAGLTAEERARSAKPSLNPDTDGSLITGDANIVHAGWSVTYRVGVDGVVDFVRNVGFAELGEPLPTYVGEPKRREDLNDPNWHGREPLIATDPMDRATLYVRAAAEQAVVHVIANTEADQVIAGRGLTGDAKLAAQALLTKWGTGITIESFTVNNPRVADSVQPAYEAVLNAESERAKEIEAARQEEARILGEVAGEAALPREGKPGPLVALLDNYELAVTAKDDARVEALHAELNRVFDEGIISAEEQVGDELVARTFRLGGEVSDTLERAQTAKTTLTQALKADEELVKRFAEKYKQPAMRPIIRSQLAELAREEIFTGDVETFYVPKDSRLYPILNRDPQIVKERQEARLNALREQTEAEAAAEQD